MKATVDVIIPVYRPGEKFRKVLSRLERQSYPVQKIILMNTGEEYWDKSFVQGFSNVEVHHLEKQDFDHGGTRAEAARLSHADIMVFMTQDAMPYDSKLIEELVKALEMEDVKTVYARQLPSYDCSVLERYTRSFNYPEESSVKSEADLPRLGIKTYFCSNVCAAYEKKAYSELGGFTDRAIFNEDMYYAAAIIKSGYKIAYAAQAQVVHSHNYTCFQQLHRNFDLGVSQAEHPEIFQDISSEGEGIRMVKETAGYIFSIKRPLLLVSLFFQSAFKYMGYFLGKRYKKLPRWLILRLTMNKEYWTIS